MKSIILWLNKMVTKCPRHKSVYSADDIPRLMKDHPRYYSDLMDYTDFEPTKNYSCGEYEDMLVNGLISCGRAYMLNALYVDPENNKENVKEHQREIVAHLRECCGCGDFLDALATDISGTPEDFLEFISKKDEYWIITGELLNMFEGGTVETEMYDAIFGSVRFLKKCIEENLYFGVEYYPTYLFSGLTMTPGEIVDILLCYSRYTLFSDIITSGGGDLLSVDLLSVDFRPEDIIEHRKEISEIHPGLVKIAEATHAEVDWAKMFEDHLASSCEVTPGTKITISVAVPSPYLALKEDKCSTYGLPHLKSSIIPSFWFYAEGADGEIYLCEKNHMTCMRRTHSTNDILDALTDDISTKDLRSILEIFAAHGTSVFVDSDEVKLKRTMGPKSAKSVKYIPE